MYLKPEYECNSVHVINRKNYVREQKFAYRTLFTKKYNSEYNW